MERKRDMRKKVSGDVDDMIFVDEWLISER